MDTIILKKEKALLEFSFHLLLCLRDKPYVEQKTQRKDKNKEEENTVLDYFYFTILIRKTKLIRSVKI